VGPFGTAPGGYRHILVEVDKFTKWIEVRAVATVTSKEAAKFIEDMTHRFGVPNRIVTDLGSAFTRSDFWDFCQDSLIDVYYASMAHPCCNGQVERANGMVLQGIKDHIFDDASQYTTRWLAELPHVIWGLRTQVTSATGYSPFFLVYGSEVVLPTDVAFGAPRMQHYKEGTAEETRKVDHYVKTSNRSRNICNGPLTPVTYTHICNGCYLAPITDKRGRPTLGLASATPVTNVDFW
jgi:hypothetical protein